LPVQCPHFSEICFYCTAYSRFPPVQRIVLYFAHIKAFLLCYDKKFCAESLAASTIDFKPVFFLYALKLDALGSLGKIRHVPFFVGIAARETKSTLKQWKKLV
jgi:hypothetical protein